MEFHDGESVAFGYVDLLVYCSTKCYFVIQKLVTEEWPICVRHQSDLSDIVSTYGNLQELLGQHFIPVHESDSLVAVVAESIIAQVVCVDCSSCLFVTRIPNTVECD